MTAQNEVTAVLRSIISVGKVHGLVLHKYRQKRIESFTYSNIYALHSGRGRPDRPENCSGPAVTIVGTKGAADKLRELLNTLEGSH